MPNDRTSNTNSAHAQHATTDTQGPAGARRAAHFRSSGTPSATQGAQPAGTQPAGKRFRTASTTAGEGGAAATSAPRRSATQAPINAAEAAHRAARATNHEENARARRAASGSSRAVRDGGAHTNKAVVAVSVLVGVALAALLVYIIGSAVLGVFLHDDRQDTADDTMIEQPLDGQQPEEQQTVVLLADGGSITYLGSSFTIFTAEDGSYQFGSQLANSELAPVALFALPGDPVGFALYKSTFYIVCNTDTGYTVQSYVPGDGSIPADYHTGEETITEIALDGSDLVLTEEGGKTYTLDLAF